LLETNIDFVSDVECLCHRREAWPCGRKQYCH